MWTTDPQEDSLINYLITNATSQTSRVDDHCVNEEDPPLLEELKNLAGSWGIHGIEKNPWNDNLRPCLHLNNFEDLQLTGEESSGILSERMVAACLSYLEQSPVVLNFALCKCVLSEKLITDISVLGNYHYLQYLDLSKNKITDLKVLGQMPFLQYLDVSENELTCLLDFSVPFNLSHVDYSKNSVKSIPDLSEFWAISHLNLSYNQISNISGLENLRFLNHLDLSFNNIEKLDNISNLRIQTLILNNNEIDYVDIAVISTLCYIRSLDISHNMLSSLKFVRKIENVENINLSNNYISDLLEVYYMKGLRYLTRVNLSANPVADEPFYTTICIRKIRNLRVLDDSEITAEKKIDAWTKSDISYLFPARESRMELMLLQQINRPKIGAHVVPYDQPPPDVIMVVGPPGSKKKTIVKKFLGTQKRIFRGVSYTTRPMRYGEENGVDYYFVTTEEFLKLMRRGELIATSEFNGYSFGIAHEELRKCMDSVVVFYSDIQSALIMKVMGICPKLVLAMPRNKRTHLKWLAMTYYYDHTSGQVKEMRIKNSPQSVQNALGSAIDDDEEEMKDDGTFEIGHVSATSQMSTYGDEEFRSPGQDEECRNIFKHGIRSSMRSDHSNIDDNSRRVSNKSFTGILKNKETGHSNDISNLREKFGSKRVSFSWMPNTDLDGEGSTSGQSRDTHRSVSDSCVTSHEPSERKDFPILSVLSANKLTNSHVGETVYMSLTERFEQLQMEKLESFFDNIMKSRKELLELHWANPGLFRAAIFTDEENDCLEQLKELLKYTVECHNTSRQIFSLDHPSFTDMINFKLKNLKLEDTYYLRNDLDEC